MEGLRYPIGTFDFEKEVQEKHISSLIDQIEALPELLTRVVEKLTEEQLDSPYRAGGWTIRQLVHHLADSNMNAYIRVKLAMTEDKPTIKPYAEALWAGLDDSQLPVELSTKLLEGLHKRWAILLRSLSSSGLERELIHPDIGLLTIKKLIDLYAWHGNHHLAQITAAISRMTSITTTQLTHKGCSQRNSKEESMLKLIDTNLEGFKLRFAEINDVPLILEFIRELANYEEMLDEVVATEEVIRESLFERKIAEVIIGEYENKPIGFALFFYNFSTFLGRPGIYLEDLYVKPDMRGKGMGKIILSYLAKLALDRECGRLEWWCLDWNEPSVKFYKQLGAVSMDDWTVFRVYDAGLIKLASQFVE